MRKIEEVAVHLDDVIEAPSGLIVFGVHETLLDFTTMEPTCEWTFR